MPLESVLGYALAAIGFLLTTIIGLVVYVFISLKGDVREVASEVGDLVRNRPKMMHKDDCRATSARIHVRLDEQQTAVHDLQERMTRTETILNGWKHDTARRHHPG